MASILTSFRGKLFDHETADEVTSMNKVKQAADDYLATVNKNLDAQYERAREYNRKRPAYVGTTTCDKCGNYARHDTQYKVHDYTNSAGEVFHDEWLARRCDGCGYKWNEAVVTK